MGTTYLDLLSVEPKISDAQGFEQLTSLNLFFVQGTSAASLRAHLCVFEDPEAGSGRCFTGNDPYQRFTRLPTKKVRTRCRINRVRDRQWASGSRRRYMYNINLTNFALWAHGQRNITEKISVALALKMTHYSKRG